MVLPGGGVVVYGRREIAALSQEGDLLWNQSTTSPSYDWLAEGDRLIVSTTGGEHTILSIDATGPVTLTTEVGGHLAATGGRIWAYDIDGIYRLNPDTLSVERLYTLPTGTLNLGDIAATPDTVLVVHTDHFDKRLIALDTDGTLRWDRSFADVIRGYRQELFSIAGQPYLASQSYNGATRSVSIFAVDLDSADLLRIFTGGTRNFSSSDTQVHIVEEDQLLINIGQGTLSVLDPRLASEIILQSP
jgi:hypothetical protein